MWLVDSKFFEDNKFPNDQIKPLDKQMETSNQLKPDYVMTDSDRARIKLDIFALTLDLAKDRNWSENQFFEFAERLCHHILD